MAVPLPVLLFGVTFVVEALGWIGNESLASFVRSLVLSPPSPLTASSTHTTQFYSIATFLNPTPHSKQVRQQKTAVLSLKSELAATSAQDEFSKWAKLRRKLDKAVAELEATNAQASGSKAAFASWFKRSLWVLTTVLPFIISSWHRKEAVFYLPNGWFGPASWWMSLPSAPAGGIACGIWTMACKKTLGVMKDIVVDLAGLGKVAPKVEEVPVPVETEGASEKVGKDEL